MATAVRDDIFDLLQDPTDPNLYIYDPRARYRKQRRRRNRSYDPRHRITRRRTYDPQFRMRVRRAGKRAKGWIPQLTSKKAGILWGVLAGLWAINQNAGGAYQPGINFFQKLQNFFVGVPYARITGNNQYIAPAGVATFPKATWNPSKAMNTATWAGIAAFIYGILPFKGLPYKGAAKRVGLPVAIGAALLGGWDPSPPGSPGILASSAPARAGATPLVAAYSTGTGSRTGGAIAAPAANAVGTLQ